MRICFDLDNTLCHTDQSGYENARPKDGAKRLLAELRQNGHTVIISTARGMHTARNNQKLAEELMLGVTRAQVNRWGFEYDELYIGIKPSADYYIDDKAIVGLHLDQVQGVLDAVLS